jgi:hypothetical protein
MDMAGGVDLFVWWARVVWIFAFVWITASHTTHVAFMRGQPRAWHLTHLAMAVGMVYMFAPWTRPPIPYRTWEMAYLAIAIAITAFVAQQWVRNRAVNVLWFAQLLAMVAMAFMSALMAGAAPSGYHVITWALVAYYCVEAGEWSRRHFAEADTERRSWIPFGLHPRPGRAVCAARLCGRVPVDLAVSGTVMSLGMAYMFLAMDSPATAWIARATRTGHEVDSLTAAVAAFIILLVVAPLPLLPPRPAHNRG